MKKLAIFIYVMLLFSNAYSQETCSLKSKENSGSINDISSITKCKVTGVIEGDHNHGKTSKVVVLSTRNHRKRRSFLGEKVRSAGELFAAADVNDMKIKDSIQQLSLANLKSKISKVRFAVKGETVGEQISFNDVESIPRFYTCFEKNSNGSSTCFNKEMEKHLTQNIIYPKKALRKNIEADIWVSFVITSEGEIQNIIATGPENTDSLKEEAIRVVSLLPKFVPGEQDNKKVNVVYSFPISFNLR